MSIFAGAGPVLHRLTPRIRSQGIQWRLVVPGRPVTKGNSQRKTRGRILPSKQAQAAQAAMALLAKANRPRRLLGQHLYVELESRFRIPQSGENRLRRPGEYRLAIPDRGNLLKLVEDALKGVVYDDDAVIVDGPARKVWWPTDETLIVVTEIEPFPDPTDEVITKETRP